MSTKEFKAILGTDGVVRTLYLEPGLPSLAREIPREIPGEARKLQLGNRPLSRREVRRVAWALEYWVDVGRLPIEFDVPEESSDPILYTLTICWSETPGKSCLDALSAVVTSENLLQNFDKDAEYFYQTCDGDCEDVECVCEQVFDEECLKKQVLEMKSAMFTGVSADTVAKIFSPEILGGDGTAGVERITMVPY